MSVKIFRLHRVTIVLMGLALIAAGVLPLTVLAVVEHPAVPQATVNRAVYVECNYFAKVNETSQVYVSLIPPSSSKVEITMDSTWGTTFSPSKFALAPGQRQSTIATIKKSISGIAWLHALAQGYDDGWCGVVVDFDGALSLSSTSALSYKSPAALTVKFVDGAGKPLRLPAALELQLESADGLLRSKNLEWTNNLTFQLPAGSQRSPEFQILSTSKAGGSVHLTGILAIEGQSAVLAQDEFSLNAEPAVWLPVLLALGGGLLHGCYKILRLQDGMSGTRLVSAAFGILVGSAIAGLIGYFFAHLDLLGLKLDPNALRSYPLIGFLFSYFGFEVLLPKRGPKQEGVVAQGVGGANPKS